MPARPALLVAVGGASGALARYGVGLAVPGVPGTVLVNLLGCLLLGLLVGRVPEHPVLRPLLGTGVLGGFTTMSTFALQTDRLAPLPAATCLAVSAGGGVLLAAAGLRLGRR